MPSKDHLLRLARFMDKAEARHFRLFSRLQKGEKKPQYLYIYDEVCKVKNTGEYDEPRLREKLDAEGKVPAKNFAVTKNYLFEAMLRSLLIINEKASVDKIIWKYFQEAQLLFSRGIWDKSQTRLDKAKELAGKYQRFALLLEILNLENKHVNLPKTPAERLKGHYERLHREKKAAIESLAQENEYTFIRDRVFALYRTLNADRSEEDITFLEALKNTPELKNPQRFLSFNSEFLYHHSWMFIHRLEDFNAEAMRHHARKIMEAWEHYPIFIKEYPRMYHLALFTYLGTCHQLGNYSEFESILEKVKQQKSRTIIERASDFHDYYHYKILMLLNTGQYYAARELAREMEVKVARYRRMGYPLRDNKLITAYYNIATLLFTIEQYDEAYGWTEKIRKELKKNLGRPDVQYAIRVLQLLILIEKGEAYKLDYRAPYLMELLEADEMLFEFDETALRRLSAISQSDSPHEDRQIYQAFLRDIEALESKLKMACGQKEAKLWVQSKLEGRPMAELLWEQTQAAMAKA